MTQRKLSILVLGLALALVAAGCSDSSNGVTGTAPGMGSLTVNLHDATSDDIAEAHVTFESVQAFSAADGSLVDVTGVETGVPVDIATLINGNQVTLAAGAMPAGDYTGLRITMSAVELVFSNGDPPFSMNLPGGGVSFDIAVGFTVNETDDAVITLDMPLGAFQPVGSLWTFDPGMVTVDP